MADPKPPRRPATRRDFEIAIICALPLEADAVEALFDHHWDDDPHGEPYDKAENDPNAYSTGSIGRHNVVLAYPPGMGKVNAATVATNCRTSFPNIRLGIVAGICGAVPFPSRGAKQVILGDVIISSGVVQYDFGRRLPEGFASKDTLQDSLGRPNTELRMLFGKLTAIRHRRMLLSKMAGYLDTLRGDPELAAEYPGAAQDKLFEASYRHVADGVSCNECGCDGKLVRRSRLEQDSPSPAVHLGVVASGDTTMKSGVDRDAIAQQADVVCFEMEGAGVWDCFPCVVIKGACDYADSHKTKAWQWYAAATAAACMKAFLDNWVPSLPSNPGPGHDPLALSDTSTDNITIPGPTGHVPEQAAENWFLVPYPRNDTFAGRTAILAELQKQNLTSASQARVSLFGTGGVGKTQIVLEYTYWLRENHPNVSVFWVDASSAELFRYSYTFIARELNISGHNDPSTDVLPLVKEWLERTHRGWWFMVIDNADDAHLLFPSSRRLETAHSKGREENLAQHIPVCPHGSILITTRDKQTGLRLAKGRPPVEVLEMNHEESERLLRLGLGGHYVDSGELMELSSLLGHLPLALTSAAALMEKNNMLVNELIAELIRIRGNTEQHLASPLSEACDTIGGDSEAPRTVVKTWILSFAQIWKKKEKKHLARGLISYEFKAQKTIHSKR